MALTAPCLNRITESDASQDSVDLPVYNEKDSDWQNVHEQVKNRDLTMLKDYDSEVDTLLVFAGLFSAILTAFIVDVYQDLKVDNAEATVAILQRMLARMESRFADPIELPPKAHPSATVMVVVALWFTSLILSLLAALFGIFIKQWLHVYSKWIDVSQAQSLQKGLVLRGFYQSSLSAWHLPDIFAGLGVLLQLALVLFVVGLVGYLWTLNFIVSPIMTVLAFIMVVLSIVTIFLPVFYEDCPYKFPMAYVLLKFRTGSTGRDWTDNDLPLAEKRLLSSGHPMERAITQLALLLDVLPDVLKSALRDLNPAAKPADEAQAEISKQHIQLVSARISQLSLASTHLLVGVVTAETVRQSHIDALTTTGGCTLAKEEMDRLDPTRDLYRLWRLVFMNLQTRPLTIIIALRHLTSTLDFAGSAAFREEEHLTLLVQVILPLCAFLDSPKAVAAEELGRVALAVDTWANTHASSSCVSFAAYISMIALKSAAEAVPRHDVNNTGLSPITPHLHLLEVLGTRVESLQRMLGDPQAYAPQGQLRELLAVNQQLYCRLINVHNSYVCVRRSGFTRMKGRTDEPRTALFSSDSAQVLVGTDEPAAWIVNVATLETTFVTPRLASASSTNYRFHSARFPRSGSFVSWGTREGPILIMNRVQADIAPVLSEMDGAEVSRTLAISRDEKHIMVGTDTTAAVMCDVASGDVVMSFEGHSRRVLRAAFSPADPPRVATTSFDNTVMVWDVETGDCLNTLLELGTEVNEIAWSHDASALAVTVGASVRIHDAVKGELINTLEGHAKLVAAVAFSPNSTLIATGSKDNTVRVWDCNISKKTFACLAVLTGPQDEVNHVDFSPDGKHLACAADDSVWIWDINPAAMQRSGEDTISGPPVQGAARNRFRSVVERMMKSRKAGVTENYRMIDKPVNSGAERDGQRSAEVDAAGEPSLVHAGY